MSRAESKEDKKHAHTGQQTKAVQSFGFCCLNTAHFISIVFDI